MTTPAAIIQAVAEAFGVTAADITGKRRAARVAYPRFAAYKLLHELPNVTLSEAGLICGNRDHGTISHGIKRAEDMLSTDPHFRAAYEGARERLKQ